MQAPVIYWVRGLEKESGLRSRRPWSLGCIPRISLEPLVVPKMRKEETAADTKVHSRKTVEIQQEAGIQEQMC